MPTRRRLLTTLGAAASGALVGCSGSEETTTPGTGTTTATPEATEPPAATPATETATPTPRPTTHTPSAATVFPDYERRPLTVASADGETLGELTVAIADTPELRFTGLSDTESLPPDAGMLFVYGNVADRTFVMRRMDFGIDIVYADESGEITRIHNAPEPGPEENGSQQTYPGRGQYVLEVNYEWTTRNGVTAGDRLRL